MFAKLMRRLLRRWFPPDVTANSVFLLDAPNSIAIKVEQGDKPLLVVDNLMVTDSDFVALIKTICEREGKARAEGYEKGLIQGKAWRLGLYY